MNEGVRLRSRKETTLKFLLKVFQKKRKKTVNGAYMVSPKGNIHLPFIKPVNVAEITSKELSERIESAYKKEYIYTRISRPKFLVIRESL